jgi:hypothetical protein
MPLYVSQQVLALHPILREPRTGSLLSTYGNKYHVQFHNPELGVFVLKDIELTPIGLNDFYKQDLDLYRQHLQVANQLKLQIIAGISGTEV